MGLFEGACLQKVLVTAGAQKGVASSEGIDGFVPGCMGPNFGARLVAPPEAAYVWGHKVVVQKS